MGAGQPNDGNDLKNVHTVTSEAKEAFKNATPAEVHVAEGEIIE